MDINPELLTRVYAVYQFFMNQSQLVPLSSGYNQPSLSHEEQNFENDPEFADFLAKLAELSEDSDGSSGGGLAGLSDEDQLKALEELLGSQSS